ncbi:MAG: hemoglobin [Betaproteobacteria bacterium]|nr:hemoglobin [Betaproteobacteria bacterium]
MNHTTKHLLAFAAFAAMALGNAAAVAQSTPASAYPVQPAPGLYQAIGEKPGIRALMDDFVVRLKADSRIGDQFKETNAENLASQLTDQVCQLAGGPCIYKGPDMKTAHEGMEITRAHFNALVEVLQASMDAKGISFQRQNQILALLAPMHRDTVTVR